MKNFVLFIALIVFISGISYTQIPTNGLVAYYPFNGNANDESGNGNNGNVIGPTLTFDRFGNQNSAYNFDGIGNYIEIPNSSTLQFQNSFTIAMWVNVKGWWRNEWAPLIAKSDKHSANTVWAMYCHRTHGWLLALGTDNVANPWMTPLSSNVWTLCVWVWDGNNYYLYLDQNKYKCKNYSGVHPINNENILLGYGTNPSINNIRFNGIMDDIRIYNRALSESDIFALYNEPNDILLPTAICKNVTLSLDENGLGTINAEDIDDGSYDESGIASLSIDKTNFDCSNLGQNTVTLTVTDNNNNSATCEATVSVVDDILPQMTVELFPKVLWPPNHKMANISANVVVSDNCSGATFKLVSITSNEPDDGLGDGDQPNDIQNADYGTPDLSFDLRKERAGMGQDRIYTVTYEVQDSEGNTSTVSSTVKVPKNQSSQSGNFEVPDEKDNDFTINEFNIQIFPNPTDGTVNVSAIFNESGNTEISISNEIGQILKKVELGATDNISHVFDISDFSSGIYLIYIKYNDEMIIRAIVKE